MACDRIENVATDAVRTDRFHTIAVWSWSPTGNRNEKCTRIGEGEKHDLP